MYISIQSQDYLLLASMHQMVSGIQKAIIRIEKKQQQEFHGSMAIIKKKTPVGGGGNMEKKFAEWIIYGGKVPRKVKKSVLGKRQSFCKLRRMIKETVVGDPIKTMHERVEFTPHGAFCPHCGEKGYVGSGNLSRYPEHWEIFYCLRCRSVVGYIDNSPFVHALECSENYFNPVF